MCLCQVSERFGVTCAEACEGCHVSEALSRRDEETLEEWRGDVRGVERAAACQARCSKRASERPAPCQAHLRVVER